MSGRAGNIIDSIEHSKTQEHRAETWVTDVFRNSDICPDKATQSKYDGMQANRAAGAKQSHEVHKGTELSWNSYHTYKSECKPLAVFVQTEFGVRDVYQITPPMVSDYLIKVVDCEVKYATFTKICSAIEKFCTCINDHNGGEGQDFHRVIDDFKESAKEALPASDFTSRTFDNPEAVIGNLSNEKFQIAAELQLTCGLRISDACHFEPEMLKGGSLTDINSKNGQLHTVTPSAELMGRIQAVIAVEGKFSVNVDAYAYDLRKACAAVGETNQSSHSFRHCFAHDRMAYWTSEGLSYQDALQHVSEEMGHHRPEITEWYLR